MSDKNKIRILCVSLVIILILFFIYYLNTKSRSSQDINNPVLDSVNTESRSLSYTLGLQKEIVWNEFKNEELGIIFSYPPNARVNQVFYNKDAPNFYEYGGDKYELDPGDRHDQASVTVDIEYGETPATNSMSTNDIQIYMIEMLGIEIIVSDCFNSPTIYKDLISTSAGDQWKIIEDNDLNTNYYIRKGNSCYDFIAQMPNDPAYKVSARDSLKNIFNSVRFTY